MLGARLRPFATRCLVDVGITSNISSTVNRARCSRIIVTRYSTRPRARQLNLAHPGSLRGTLDQCRPFVLSMSEPSAGWRLYATEQKPASTQEGSKSESIISRLLEEEQQQPKALTVAERVVRAGKDTTYFLVICIGVGITAVLLYYVFGELFSSNSVQRLFSVALKRIRADEKSKAILGEPISAHGEMSGRNRRRNISHQEYIVDGEEYMRMQFYVSGSKQQATAHLDVKKNSSGNYECRFLFLELSGYPGGTIIIEDNR